MKFDRDEEEEKEGKSEYKKRKENSLNLLGRQNIYIKKTIGGGEKMGMVESESKKKSKGKIKMVKNEEKKNNGPWN